MEEKLSKTVHHVLSYSYTSFFFGLIFGLILDFFLKIRIFTDPNVGSLGLLFILLGSLLALWAQKTSRVTETVRHNGEHTAEDFKRGPYRYTRSPTHIGLTLLSLGVGIIMNSALLVFTSFLASMISHTFFLGAQDKILEEKYGEPYKEYKKSVSRWF